MKKFLMLLFVVFIMITAYANTIETNVNEKNVNNNYYSVELTDTINKVHIAIPCRVIYGADESLDTTMVNTMVIITDRSEMFNVYCIKENNMIYIKSNLRQDDLSELEKNNDVNTPIIRIMTKTKTNTPQIIAGSGFNIIQNRYYGKATALSNN